MGKDTEITFLVNPTWDFRSIEICFKMVCLKAWWMLVICLKENGGVNRVLGRHGNRGRRYHLSTNMEWLLGEVSTVPKLLKN